MVFDNLHKSFILLIRVFALSKIRLVKYKNMRGTTLEVAMCVPQCDFECLPMYDWALVT